MFIRRAIQAFLLLVALTLASCVHTRITAYRDPEPALGPYRRIAVDYLEGSLFNKEKAEQILATVLEDRSERLDVLPCCEFLPPTRRYTDQEFADLLQKNDCDGYLSVQLVDRVIKEDSPFGVSVIRQATPEDMGVSVLREGAETLSQEIEIKLIDVADNRCVWTASSMTSSYGMNKFKTAIRSMARKVASQLIVTGLIR